MPSDNIARLQDLPPRWARFCLKVRAFAARELACDFPALPCLVALSGGADSTALLVITALLCRIHGGSVQAAHLNHLLRPEAEADAAFAAELCHGLGVPLISESRDVAQLASAEGLGLEEAGRKARYEFLERARRQAGAEVILVAHQLNDLAEDQLLRLSRGVGWPALGGMPGRDAGRALLRPLLLTPRRDIEAFLKAVGRPWRDDSTNFEPICARNRMRQEALPALVRENPSYLASAARLWRQARVDAGHWERAVAELPMVNLEDGGLLLPARALDAAGSALRLRAFKAALDSLGPGQALGDTLLRLDELWAARAFGKALRFPGDKEARLAKKGVRFRGIDRKKECG